MNDFVLPAPDENDPLKTTKTIYFFSTPRHMRITVSRKDKTKDVIRHIITMYQRRSDLNTESPLQFPDNPEAYELRLIDDDEDFYIPFYEISAIENEEPVGDFQALAFCKRKGFKPPVKEENKNSPGTLDYAECTRRL